LRKGTKSRIKLLVLNMRFTHLIFLLNFLFFFSCKQQQLSLIKIEGKQIPISDSLKLNSEIDAFIKPYREHIEKDLDSVLAYAVDTYSKSDGQFNTAIGNLMVDIVYSEGNPVFNKRTGGNIDFVLLNNGGIRAIISKGAVTARTAYEVMPFENSIVVVGLKGKKILNIIDYLVATKKAHPFSWQLKLLIDKDYNPIQTTINGNEIDTNKTYFIATSDYLANMGDDMTFFQPNEGVYPLDYKIRNALIDNFKKVDTINPVIDNRFIQIK
jgi:2',3'-cyclic-nucleotide 2'-phosphodiesterase (5'-nucleotidase family)